MRALVPALTLCVLLGGCATMDASPEAALRMPAEARTRGDRQLVVTFPDSGVVTRSAAGASPRPYAGRGGYDGSAHAQWLAARLGQDYGLTRVAGWHIGTLGVHCVVYEAPSPADRNGLIARLRGDPRVASAQQMVAFETRGNIAAYDDPLFPLQTAVAALQVPEAHAAAQGRQVRVAVIDTGVDDTHPDLAGRVRQSWNLVDDDTKAFRSDRHGTAVAGVLAAVGRNGLGIVGIAPGVEILAMKACWETAPGRPGRCNTLTLAAALDLAIANEARVINLSLGGPEDPLLRRLVEAAIARDIVVVAPEGGTLAEGPGFPGAVEGVLAVADADTGDTVGGGHLAAPGHNLLTLVPGERFDFVSGESYSAAIVSGIAALLLERRALDPRAVESLIAETAGPGATASATVVNACRAVARVAPGLACSGALVATRPADTLQAQK